MQATSWPARKKWTHAYLRKAFKGQAIVAGNYSMSFEDYLAYADASCDDMPLYLFDCKFAQKAPQLAADYKVSRPATYTLIPCKWHMDLTFPSKSIPYVAAWRISRSSGRLRPCSGPVMCKVSLKPLSLQAILKVTIIANCRSLSNSQKTCSLCWANQGGQITDGSSWALSARGLLFTRTPTPPQHGMQWSRGQRSGCSSRRM